MKRIKHNDLTHYFLRDRSTLPRAYVASCEKFFKSIKLEPLAWLQAPSTKKAAAKAASSKRQARKYLTPTKSLI
jgi:hypothetical protein